jgi:hypothetical protein
MRILLPLFYIVFFYSCKNSESRKMAVSESKDSFQKDIPDTANNARAKRDFTYYVYKNRLTERLSLKNIENGSDSFELRFWSIGSNFDPVILYVLKEYNSNWTSFHYQVYRGDSWNSLTEPKVDSLIVNFVKPRNDAWQAYIQSLAIDSLWKTPSQWQVVGPDFGAVDGYTYIIELADSRRYKYIHYYVPDFLKDKEPNHRRVFNFRQTISDSLVYKEMRNL